MKRENKKTKYVKHGYSYTSEYSSWNQMVVRCTNKNNRNYLKYGAKGITVCKGWLDFKNFIKDMGNKPTALHTIDRIDGTKGYYKENCRWATMKQQSNNRSFNRNITEYGETLSVSMWCDALEIDPKRVYERLRNKWSNHSALFAPKHSSKS